MNNRLKIINLMFMLFCLASCVKNEISFEKKEPKQETPDSLSLHITNIKVENHQIKISGSGLSQVTQLQIKGESGATSNLEIESKNSSEIIANGLSNITFTVGKAMDFIFSSAHAASSFTVDFSLCDATIGGHGFNCSVAPNDKEVMSFDASTGKWRPRSVNGLSFRGTWDANDPFPSGADSGDYYIVSIPSGPYDIGDWIVFNGSTWDEINNANSVVSVFGRTGTVSAQEGDYELDHLSDVDLSVAPTSGQVLTFSGSEWIASSLSLPAETDPSVQGFAKALLPVCPPGEVLTSTDGTSFDCVVGGGSAFSGTSNRAVITDGTGALTTSGVTSTELNYLSGVTSNLQTQLGNKLNSSSFVDWSAVGMETIPSSRVNLGVTSNGVVISTGGVLSTSSITSSELGYLSGVTSNIQTQLDDKLSSTLPTCDPGEMLTSNGTTFSCVTMASGGLTVPDGNAAAPSYGFSSSSNTGIFKNGNSVAVSIGGSISGQFNPTGFYATNISGTNLSMNTNSNAIYNPTGIESSPEGSSALFTNGMSGNGLGSFVTFQSYRQDIVSQMAYLGLVTNSTGHTPDFVIGAQTGASSYEERLRITKDGNVGIGTFDPQAKLEVNGGIKIGDDASCILTKAGTIRYNGGNVEFCNGVSWASLGASPTGVTEVFGSGPISVTDGAAEPVISITQANSLVDGYLSKEDWISFNSKQEELSGKTINGVTYPSAAGGTLVVRNPAANNEVSNKLYVDNSVGSALATAQGYIDGKIADAKIYVDDLFATAPDNFATQYGNSWGESMILGTTDNYSLRFKTNDEIRMAVTNTGYVGIGVLYPGFALDVHSNDSEQMRVLHASNAQFDGAGIILSRARGDVSAKTPVQDKDVVGGIYFRATDSSLSAGTNAAIEVSTDEAHTATARGSFMIFETTENGTNYRQERMRISSNGNVGIGDFSANPEDMVVRLTVDGDTDVWGEIWANGSIGSSSSIWTDGEIFALGNINTEADLYADGCIMAGATNLGGTCVSDSRLKSDVHPFTLGLDEVLGINPVYYRYNGLGGIKHTKNEQLGVIAQDLEKSAPELIVKKQVKLNPEDNFLTEIKGVNYGAFTYTIINAVKELYVKIVGVDKKNIEQDREIASLKAENAALKAYLCSKDPAAPICD